MKDYKSINKQAWDAKVDIHLNSDFYGQEAFLKGETSLKEIELDLLPEDLTGMKILHLQCHFGQDSISLARMGADVTGVDFSSRAIEVAREVNNSLALNCRFIQSDVYNLPQIHNELYDIVFTSYGVLGWLPDMQRWAEVVHHFLKPGGKLVLVEFHPVAWMFDDNFEGIAYDYNSAAPIVETYSGSYADKEADIHFEYMMWNHSLSKVLNSLIQTGLTLQDIQEYDFSPYACYNYAKEVAHQRFKISKFKNEIPLTFSVVATK